MIVTKEMLLEAQTVKGGYSGKQIKLAQEKFPGKWKNQLLGAEVSSEFWDKFTIAVGKRNRKAKRAYAINKISKPEGWEWKPTVTDIPTLKFKGKKGKNSAKRQKVSKFNSKKFYTSSEWRELRVRVIEKYEAKCMMCGESPKVHKIVIHVDHIKPRSKFPELSLDFNNLQLLCEACNLGKSNKYQTDWRPDELEDWELELLTGANARI